VVEQASDIESITQISTKTRKEVMNMICTGCCEEEALTVLAGQLEKIAQTIPEIREVADKLQELVGVITSTGG